MSINLKDFCSLFEGGTRLYVPFVIDGWAYGTDGKICVRIPADHWGGETGDGHSSAADLPWEEVLSPPCFRWERGPKEMAQCPACYGDGMERTDCPDCDGAGAVECETCGNDYDCEKCRGRGYLRGGICKTCNAKGETIQGVSVPVKDGYEIGSHYADLIESLPDFHVCGMSNHACGGVVFFSFDGGSVCVALQEVKL